MSPAKNPKPYEALPTELPQGGCLRYPHRGRAELLRPDDTIKGRGLSVAIIGASGSAGRQIAMSVIARRRFSAGLSEAMTIQFVGQRGDNSLGPLIGLCSELRDAFDEHCPHLEVVVDIEAVEADIIVMAAGASMSHKYRTFTMLARANVDVFDYHAEKLLEKNGRSVIVIVSNPAEFAVECFVAAGFHPERVLGFGAHLDTLRFRRELASELGVSRQHISGLVLGKHGLDMVPCWSTVQLAPHCSGATEEKLERLKAEGLARMPLCTDDLRKLAYEIREMAESNNALGAAALVNRQPPDMRASLRRYISHFTGPLYPRVGIGENVAQLVLDIIEGRNTLMSAQVYVDGSSPHSFLGIKGQAIGAPVILSCHGAKLTAVQLTKKEEEAVQASALEAVDLNLGVRALKIMRKIRDGKSGPQK